MLAWLQRNRTSVRIAFGLRLFVMVANGLLSLFWTRLILFAMGDSLNGLFIAFMRVARLGGLGDLGMGGAVGLRAGQMLGAGNEVRLRSFLANARAVFLFLGAAVFAVLLLASPWMPGWLRFGNDPHAGSLTLLFAIGAVSAGLLVGSSYFQNLNYAHGTVMWPILPSLLFAQLSFLGQWLLARAHAPLWLQYLPYLLVLILGLLLAKKMLDWSHPWLGNVTPLRCDRAEWKLLLTASGWVYLCSLGNLVFTTTDSLVINGAFGSAILPTYINNYKLCELALTLVVSASAVSIPKITQWLASQNPEDQQRARIEIHRLNQFQVVLGCAAALTYLAINDLFIHFWLGDKYHAPLLWQIAFALNLAVTTGGDAGIQISGRCGQKGIRAAGLTILVAGIVNLVLALVSAKCQFLPGIPFATVAAQSFLNLALGWYVCGYLGLSLPRWTAKTWLLPVGCIMAATGLKQLLPGQSLLHLGALLGCYGVLLLLVGWLAGINREMLRTEWAIIRGILKI